MPNLIFNEGLVIIYMQCFTRMKIDAIRQADYSFGDCEEVLKIGKKASAAFKKAQELYLHQRQTSNDRKEIDMNTLRYPANNPGLFGEISSNLLVIDLLLGANPLKEGDLRVEFLEHLVDPTSTRDISLMFAGISWAWAEYIEYISTLFQRTQECFLTVTRKFAYAPQDKNTSATFRNLVSQFDQKLGRFYIDNWRRNLVRFE